MGNMKFDIPPTPMMDYFSSEDAPLLEDFIRRNFSDPHRHPHLHHDHPHFEVASFPETPLLQDCSDDEFSDFVESPASEVPPEYKAADVEDSSMTKLADLPTLEYIQHVAIIVFIQLLIPIPFMLPMGLNFVKRSTKVLFPSFLLGVVGHSLVHMINKPVHATFLQHMRHSVADPTIFIPAFFSQLKIGILGGFLTGAIMSHVLNLFILSHTICRLVRGLEPQPSAMRRAMDSSTTFQFLRGILLDAIAGTAMFPLGSFVRQWYYDKPSSGLLNLHWHSIMVGIVGAVAVQGYSLMMSQSILRARPLPTDAVQLAAKLK